MPTEAYDVDKIFAYPVRGDQTRYDIQLLARATDVHDTIVSTLKPWAASLCQRAKDLRVPVSVGWKDSRFGPELVTVTLLSNPPETVADAEAAAYLTDPLFAEERR